MLEVPAIYYRHVKNEAERSELYERLIYDNWYCVNCIMELDFNR